MTVLRTPESRFEGLAGFDHSPHFTEIEDEALGTIRIAHVAAGPKDGPVVLLLHGEPSWSYLYRDMIPLLAKAGARVLAPDLVGFGRSDKPDRIDDYSYGKHVAWMQAWFDKQKIRDVTLFCQDWGGLIGLRLVAAQPDAFAAVAASNTFLPTGDREPSEAFLKWRGYSQKIPEFDSGQIIQGATVSDLSAEVVAAYNAPFPDDSFKAGARVFPMLVPISADDPESSANRQAWEVLESFEKPFLTLFGDSDPVTRGGDQLFRAKIPGCAGQPHQIVEKGGHFIQEDAAPQLAEAIISLMRLK
jgi:haloalkane dehalogenase|tara:strand:- start:51312 stop:52217 length:906 start_codon:yes stop_codon:yes gene_type:complete